MIIENVRVKSARLTEADENGKYRVIFAINDEKLRKTYIDMIDKEWKDNKPKGKKNPTHVPYIKSETSDDYPDADEDTGTFIFSATQNEMINDKPTVVEVYNDAGVKYAKDDIPNIGKGSIINISVGMSTWNVKTGAGVSFWLNKVQILDLVEYSGGDTFGNVSGSTFNEVDFSKLDEAIEDEDADKAKELFKELKKSGADKAELKKRKKQIKAL